MLELIPPGWRAVLRETLADPKLRELEEYVTRERATHDVYPEDEEVFAALRVTPYASVRAVILGQDPYHSPGRAHGLAFSVPSGIRPPPSLANILREANDPDSPVPTSGCLVPWAERGVLLLNTVLTVRRGKAGSHAGKGWEMLTEAIIRAVNDKPGPIVFLLWGARPGPTPARSIDRLT